MKKREGMIVQRKQAPVEPTIPIMKERSGIEIPVYGEGRGER
jgi:hypothetical protein